MKELRSRFLSLSQIPELEWEHFATYVSTSKLEKGKLLCEAGQNFRKIAFVKNGLLKISYNTCDGKIFIRNFVSENQFATPYSAILRNLESDVDIIALENSEVFLFSYDDFKIHYERHLCWQEIGRKLAEAIYIFREAREFEFLALDARGRYEAFKKQFGHIQNRLTQVDVASYLGITAVSLSRILRNA